MLRACHPSYAAPIGTKKGATARRPLLIWSEMDGVSDQAQVAISFSRLVTIDSKNCSVVCQF